MTNTKSTKRALLASVMAMLLCFTMLLGTTFAWFTDSVTSANNIIQSGNLDIELEYWDGNSWETVHGTYKLFTGELWEPGHTEVVYFKMSNLGSLASKYQLGINIASETSSISVATDKEFKLSDFIRFSVVGNVNGETAPFADRATAVAEAQKVANGNKKLNEGYSDTGYMLAKQEPIYMAMVVYMPESVGNEANYKKDASVPTIDLGVNLMATQKDFESDSFGTSYDVDASKVVNNIADLRTAINNAVDGEIIFIESGSYVVDNVITINNGKNFTICGLGTVTMENIGNVHFFNVTNESTVTFQNLDLDGNGDIGKGKNGIFVRYNSTVTLIDSNIYNNKGSDICIDQCSDELANVGKTATVKLINSTVGDVSACALPAPQHSYGPINSITGDSYVKFYFDSNSSVGTFTKDWFAAMRNIYINDDNGIDKVLYANNDAQLAQVLNTINTNKTYWNTTDPVIVNLGANTFTGDHALKQYPDWNGTLGTLNYDTLTNFTNVKFVGTNDTVIAGNFVINGWGSAGNTNTWDKDKTTTEFVNVTFDGSNSTEDGNAIALYMTAAASNVKFEECTFQNASHVNFGGNGHNRTGNFTFNKCEFINGNNLSGYFNSLTVTDSTVTNATKGFINEQGTGSLTVKDCVIDDAGEYFLRNNGNVKVVVENTTIGAVADLIIFRGGNNTVTFTGCTLPAGYAVKYTNAAFAGTTTCNINGVPVVGTIDAMKAAIANGATEVILAAGTYTLPTTANKEVTISGTKDTVIDLSNGTGQMQNMSFVFDGVTIKGATQNYKGIIHSKSVAYKNCTLTGLQFLYAETVTFENCDFDSQGEEHSIWTYGSKNVSFIGCDFTYGDRAVNVYTEDSSLGLAKISFSGCTFTTDNANSKGAIEINSGSFKQNVEVSIADCTAPAYGEMVGISGYDAAVGANVTITVDGAVFTPGTQWVK